MIWNLILSCAIHPTMSAIGIVGIVGVENNKIEENNETEQNNENVEDIDNSLINIYEKFQNIKTINNKKYDKFNFNKNITHKLNINNYNGTKPIPIPNTNLNNQFK